MHIRSRPEKPAASLNSKKILLVLFLFLLLLAVRSRDRPRSDNANRHLIEEYIRDHLGCTQTALIRQTGLNRGTVRHHLRILLDNGRIINNGEGRCAAIFSSKSVPEPPVCTLIAHFQSQIRAQILTSLFYGPGTCPSALASALGMKPTTLHYHLRMLVNDGLVQRRPGRKPGRYYLSHNLAEFEEIYTALISLAGSTESTPDKNSNPADKARPPNHKLKDGNE